MFKKIVISSCMAFVAMNACAVDVIGSDPIYVLATPLSWGSIITASGGIALASPGQNQYLYPYPNPYYEHAMYNSKTRVSGTGEIFFGLQRSVNNAILGELGLGVAAMSDATVTGIIDIVNAGQQYSYSYKVHHARIELKGRLIADNWLRSMQPYLSGSFGVGYNGSHDYEPVVSFVPLYSYPWYASNTALALSYTLGIGVQTKITPHWQVGVGYQFADLGKSYLNNVANDTTVSEGLRMAHLYTNEFLLNVSYAFS
ncbi:MAG: hypothetical protein PSV35_10540 [bacterium]|nr:hypothetical protein [bacterium]